MDEKIGLWCCVAYVVIVLAFVAAIAYGLAPW